MPPTSSPIFLLQEAIASAPFAIAQERAVELERDPTLKDFSLTISSDVGYAIRVNTDTKETTLPVFSLEYIWCFSHLLLILSEEYEFAQQDGKEVIDLQQSAAASKAIDLLNWAQGRMLHNVRSPWPEGMPQPQSAPPVGSIIHATNEIFLAAIAWIIHHEIAHVRLKHGVATTYSVQQEIEADTEATNWLFSEHTEDDARLKRQLGMAVALLSIQFLEVPRGEDSKVESHPPSLERIDRCFEIARVANDGFICAFTTIALQFQLENLNIKTELDGNSWNEIMSNAMISFITAGRK